MSLVQSRIMLQDILEEKQKEFEGDNSILGISSLTFPAYIDSSRTIMDVNHQLQRVVLDYTEFPYMFTNSENMFGHLSTYNITASGDLDVYRIIPKFPELDLSNEAQPVLIIFFNHELGEYDLLYKQDVQNLPEKYGFQYDHSVLDNLKEGDTVSKGTTLTRPTSYDEFDNYGFGQNVNCAFRVDSYSIEDGIQVSSRLAKSYVSTEVELVKVTLNTNNILGNDYGDDDNYKCFPDIGEQIKDNRLCIWKILNNSQVLYDMKSCNTKKSMVSDVNFWNNGTIIDIDIFCNNARDDIPDTIYNNQILKYVDMDIRFHQNVVEATQGLIDKGYKVSNSIKEWNKRCKELLNKDEKTGYKIKDDTNSAFGGIQIYFLIKRKVGLYRGQKLVGRYGNKGVISRVVPTREMPHLETGEPIDIIFASLGVPGRLNIFQLYEQTGTAQAKQVRDYIRTLKTLKEKEDIFFKFLSIYNEDQAKIVYDDYIEENKTKKQRMDYFKNYIEKYGIFIHIEAFWHKKLMWDCINEVYDTFDFLRPYKIYFWQKETQRWVRQIRDEYSGTMYIMKLKQSSKKGLSVRSTGPVNNFGLPDKSDDVKKFIIRHSNTPVRLGRQEMENQLMFMDPESIVKEFLFQRNSPIARMELGTKLMENYKGVYDIDATGLMTNRNVEMLEVHLLQMGYELQLDYDVLDLTEEPGLKTHIYNGRKYICTSAEMRKIIAEDLARARIETLESGEIYLGKISDFDQFIEQIGYQLERQIEDYMY